MPGFLKKIIYFHILPILIAGTLCAAYMRYSQKRSEIVNSSFTSRILNTLHSFDKFYPNDITHETALAVALKERIPVLFGSSELTSHHLKGIAQQFFGRENSADKFLAVGHAGFQSFAILTTLAANRPLLKDAKITIILSPGWFEGHYASGTSLPSFFEFCPPNYLYQIYKDTAIDKETKHYIKKYIYENYDKITKPNAILRAMGKKQATVLNTFFNYPFKALDRLELYEQEQKDFYLVSQNVIVNTVYRTYTTPYKFKNRTVNWDSLNKEALQSFELISNNNTLGVENKYYESGLKNKPKKKVKAVNAENNQELKDFKILIRFLKENHVKPLFVIMPLNTLAHENLEALQPTINDIKQLLKENDLKTLDMFSPNVTSYQKGVLEDMMHPYNVGWYKIDKFILDNYYD